MNDTTDIMSRLVRRTPITLVVATTPITRVVSSSSKESPQTLLGIGLNGTLPWPRIKADMNFFARVTSRRPGLSSSSSSTTSTTSPTQASCTNNDDSQKQGNNDSKNKNKNKPKPKTKNLNAIIMGRKTYYSLPKGLRPLKDRLSVIISRDAQGQVAAEVASDLARQLEKNRATNVRDGGEHAAAAAAANVVRDAFVAHSLEEALNRLLNEGQQGHGQGQGPDQEEQEEEEEEEEEEEDDARRVFVIGGGEIYDSSLRLELPSIVHRILMTRVKRQDGREFDCDTFFPLTDDDLSSSSSSSQGNRGWRRVGKEELEDWVGEKIEDDWSDQGEVAIKIEGYERLLPLPTPCT